MSDARLVETRNQLTKCEKQLTSEQTKNKKLAGRVQELVTMTESSDANVKSKDEQVEILHVGFYFNHIALRKASEMYTILAFLSAIGLRLIESIIGLRMQSEKSQPEGWDFFV